MVAASRGAPLIEDLPWLPRTPGDFRRRLDSAKVAVLLGAGGADEAWATLAGLAGHALGEAELSKLASLASKLPDGSHLPALETLAILGDGTLSLLAGPIVASALRRNLRLRSVVGNAVADALDTSSPLHLAKPDMALLAFDRRGLGLDRFQASEDASEALVDRAFATVRSVVAGLRQALSGPIFVQTAVPPPMPILGSLERAHRGAPLSMVEAFNRRLGEWARSGEVVLVDVASLAATVGLERWSDATCWHQFKVAFAAEFVPVYADFVARTIAAARGRSRKCLVLDLDNTIWGGAVGDDGVEGLVLGQGSGTGEAFLEIQRMALDLHARGVILAVCSRNDDAIARRPFREHPEMALRESHIAVFQANWADKAANLRAISRTLGIGLEALVLIDDNPAERAHVRAELPAVGVPELPADPAHVPAVVLAAGYFESLSFGAEDQRRGAYYATRVESSGLQAAGADLESYLRSLDMVCTIGGFDATGRARIAQLINKSNQFNLTTRRRSEAEIFGLTRDPGFHHLQVRLADRFGDHGMISVLIAAKAEAEWTIDTWLMSCRVLKRGVEQAVLANLVRAALLEGATQLVGGYLPTAMNAMVADHYPKLGFSSLGRDGDTTLWSLELSTYTPPDLPMRVVEEIPASAVSTPG